MPNPHIEYKGSHGGGSPPARIRIEAEREAPHGWEFDVLVRSISGSAAGASETHHTVTLSYRDHDMWTGGKMSPSALIEQVVAYVLRNRAEPLPPKFDAARVRYWFPKFDAEMRGGSHG